MRKKLLVLITFLILTTPMAFAAKPDVNTITAGEVFYSSTHYQAGEPIPTGFDEYGYNYQGHMFSGSYFNSYAGGSGFPAWEGDDEAYMQRLIDEGYYQATLEYGDVPITSNEYGNFLDVIDLTNGDAVIKFTYDANGLVDNAGSHAYSELGVRTVGYGNFNPNGQGIWMATDYDYAQDGLQPDIVPTLDLDDKIILQKMGGHGEADYDLPATPPEPTKNHRVWWDRDGVDPWQNDETANTEGIYDVELILHADDDTTGTAYLKINGLWQGFETDSDWSTIELTPAGMTFTADMTQLQVFFGIWAYGPDTHSVEFKDVTVEYWKAPPKNLDPMAHWSWPFREVHLDMKWNDAWISNKDYSGDGLLDRHWGYPTYSDSGAWLTNHQRGVDEGEKWTYFTKIVTPSPINGDYVAGPYDENGNGVWYTADGVEIGPQIWGAFAIIQEVASKTGATYHSPYSTGFGAYPAY